MIDYRSETVDMLYDATKLEFPSMLVQGSGRRRKRGREGSAQLRVGRLAQSCRTRNREDNALNLLRVPQAA